MNRFPFASPARLPIAFVAICLAGFAAQAQNKAAGADQAPTQAPGAQPAPKPNPDNEWLARASKFYYSSAKAGLTGFDCEVHPDWHTLFVSANTGNVIAQDDPRIVLLKTVRITFHARMKGGSTIDWVAPNPDQPLDKSSTDMLEGMHQAVQQALEGFMQFWTPFVDGSAVPDSAEGLDITHTATEHTIHAKQGDTEVTEILSSDLVLEQFNVVLNGASVKFSPVFKPTAQGLLVNRFVAHILAAGAPPEQSQEMTVDIEYQTAGGFTIPSRLKMGVLNSGIFNFVFAGCSANPQSN
jgi:hypothetical protein